MSSDAWGTRQMLAALANLFFPEPPESVRSRVLTQERYIAILRGSAALLTLPLVPFVQTSNNAVFAQVLIPSASRLLETGILAFALDVVTVSVTVYASGGLEPNFGFLYYLMPVSYVRRFPSGRAIAICVAAALGYAIAATVYDGPGVTNIGLLTFRVAWILVFAVFADVLGNRARTAEAGLAAELGRTRALLRAAHAPTTSLTVDGVLAAILEQVRLLTDSRAAAVRLFASDARRELNKALADDYQSGSVLRQLIIDDTAPALLLSRAEPMTSLELLSMIGELPRSLDIFTSLCGAAIDGTDGPLGLVVVAAKGERVLTLTDLEVLTAFLERAALAIQNAQLYEKLQAQMDELRAMHDRVVRTERLAAIGEVAAKVAHEVNNPLTSIQLYNSLLLEEHVDFEEQRRIASNTLEQVERAKRVVRDILDYSRPSVPQMENGSLNEAVEQALPLVEHAARSVGVTIETHLGAQLPMVRLDKSQIAQVVTNLTINAVHAMQGGGCLIIETGLHEGELFARFEDNGVGIAPEQLDHIFEPFFSTQPVGRGTGLGLAVCRSVVSHHSGRITVESQLGVGSRFTVWLPGAHVEEGVVASSAAE
ncbi:MAG: signal transduction histidine kinase, nitrogen specific, NtrB [Chloroflexi bacterium]|nr:signal transduction histidine kinase, nitrogen specific, NtrB [Chloroflexota bacterium]